MQVFICEQKLYTKPQLNQHIKNGDSEVDGSEVERRGFVGHPICEFCRSPFYGKTELSTHMTRDHYSCHICERCSATVILLVGLGRKYKVMLSLTLCFFYRQGCGQYGYFRDYDDLEV